MAEAQAKKKSRKGTLEPEVITIFPTMRCNFGCSFCFVGDAFPGDARNMPDMRLADFKHLIDEIKKARLSSHVVIAGGEPFLHKDALDMVEYAVGVLGPSKVQVTTNMSQFPLDPQKAEEFLRRLNGARLNMSLDPEHLKFDPRAPARIKGAFEANKRAPNRAVLKIISVATGPNEPALPPELEDVLPKHLVRTADRRVDYIHRGTPSDAKKPSHAEKTGLLKDEKEGLPLYDIWALPDGRLMGTPGAHYLLMPQHSIGNWKKEPMERLMNQGVRNVISRFQDWAGFESERSRLRAQKGLPVGDGNRKRQLLAKSTIRAIDRTLIRRANAVRSGLHMPK